MKRKPIRILAVLFAFAIFVSSTLAVSAASVETMSQKTARVSTSLLTGTAPDLKDFVSVAKDQMNTTLADGYTTIVDENNNLLFVQVLSSGNMRSINETTEIAASSLLLTTNDTKNVEYVQMTAKDTLNISNYSIYAVHTTYITVRCAPDEIQPYTVYCNKMTSKLTYNGSTSASSLYHQYQAVIGFFDIDPPTESKTSSVVSPVVENATYTYYPPNPRSYNVGTTGAFRTYSNINVGGNNYFLVNTIPFDSGAITSIIP